MDTHEMDAFLAYMYQRTGNEVEQQHADSSVSILQRRNSNYKMQNPKSSELENDDQS